MECVVTDNNFLGKLVTEGCAIAAPCRAKVAEKVLEIGVKAGITGIVAKEIADKISSEDLDHLIMLQMMGNDEITQSYLNTLELLIQLIYQHIPAVINPVISGNLLIIPVETNS
ncbi:MULTISPECIES: hypothetical protein [Photorhabdus]|uniref:Uncharacterized protein n=1 Tax=Photorhabdus luminescens TaxID=29488 RepID=A0A1G5RBL5_PHOLU|nr:hypothetical protein [Photorhabdus luminescens]SCZ70679.1 hypothetical protein SAMN02982990_03563 [Photorhabdus luminescens]